MFFAKKISLADGRCCSKYPELLESIFEAQVATPNSKNTTCQAFALEDIPRSEEIPPLECADGRSLFAGWSSPRPMGLPATRALANHLQAFRSVKLSELQLPVEPRRTLLLEKVAAAHPGGHFEDCYKLTEYAIAKTEHTREQPPPDVFARARTLRPTKQLSMSEPFYALFEYRGRVVLFGRKRISVLNEADECEDEVAEFGLRDCDIYAKAFYAAVVDRSATSTARWGGETLVCVYKTSSGTNLARFGDLDKAEGELIHSPLRDPERKSKSTEVLLDFELPEIDDYLNDNEDKFARGGFPQSLPYYAVDAAGRVWIQGTRELRVYSPAFELLAAAPLAADAEGLAIYPATNGEVHVYIPDEESSAFGGAD